MDSYESLSHFFSSLLVIKCLADYCNFYQLLIFKSISCKTFICFSGYNVQ